MLTLKLAIKNISAHKQRSLIMFVAVATVSCLVFLFIAFSDGEMENFKSGLMALVFPSGDIVLYSTGLKTAIDQGDDWEHTSTLSIKGYSALLAGIRALPFVKHADTPTTAISLDLFAAGQKYEGFIVRGVDPVNAYSVYGRITMKDGGFFDGSDKPEIILHYKTAPSLKVRPGDAVTITGKDLFGQAVVQQAVLQGFLAPDEDSPSLASFAFVNMAAYNLISGFAPDETLSILIELNKGVSRVAALRELRAWIAQRKLNLEAWDFDDIPKPSTGVFVYQLVRLIFLVASLLIISIVTFGLMNVVSVNLYDRKREIGTYYCLGSEKGFLARLYTLEIMILTLASTFAGVIVGLGVRGIMNSLAIRTEEPGLQRVFGGSTFALGFSVQSLLFLFCSMLVVTTVTAATTLGKRLSVPPLAALRETE